jgi:AcrR family transcriptional regulator
MPHGRACRSGKALIGVSVTSNGLPVTMIPATMIDNWRNTDGETETLRGGRHRMSKEEVYASQRARLLRAVLDEVGTIGASKVTVSGVVDRAKVSKKTFYEQFSGLDECLLEAIDVANEMLRADIERATSEAGGDRSFAALRSGLTEYLAICADDPALSLALLTGWASLRSEATERWLSYQTFLEGIVVLAYEAEREISPELPEVNGQNVIASLGFLRYATMRRLMAGDYEQLRSEASDVVDTFLTVLRGT